jgi:enamine deaminase RidA (YjgF/YER057c/UK114 family)
MRENFSSGSSFEEQIAYSRAVKIGNQVFVSGTTGYDYSKMEISEDVVAQCRQCFENISKVLEQTGASLSDVVRVTYIVPNPNDFEPCWPVIREYFSTVKPAATMIVAALLNATIKIEIEVTAVLE